MKPRLSVLCLLSSVLCLTACSTAPDTGVRFWNPWTWTTHRPAALADQAKAEAAAEQAKLAAARWSAVSLAHAEFSKSGLMLSFAPPSREVEFSQRFTANGLGLLDQIDPLPAAEVADLRRTIADLRSENTVVRAAAEKSQAGSEATLAAQSRALGVAEAVAAAAEKNSQVKDTALRAAFDRENSLANELRNEHMKFWVAIAGVVLLTLLSLYLRAQFGGVGAAFHSVVAMIPAEKVPQLEQTFDANVSGPVQGLIRAGREQAAAAEAKLTIATQHLIPPAA